MSLKRRSKNHPISLLPPWDTTLQDGNDATGNSPRLLSLPPVSVAHKEGNIEELVRVDGTAIPSRIYKLEERVQAQERTTQALIDRAYRIKEDVINSFNFTKGTMAEERQALDLLQEHIHSITAVVKRLNGDIMAIEESIKARDNAHVGTNNAVKNLEVNQVAGLTDLKGRVVRCDSAIAQMGKDVTSCVDSIQQLNKQHQDLSNRIVEKLNGLEQQIININNEMERTSGESRIKLSHLEGDTNTQVSRIDSKARQTMEEVKVMASSLQTNVQAERERMEQRLTSIIEKDDVAKTLLIEKLEKRLEDLYQGMDARVSKVEKLAVETKYHFTDAHDQIEARVRGKMDGRIKRNTEEVLHLKQEARKAFTTVHENMTTVKRVLEGRHKLLEDQLLKELGQIRKVVM